MPAGIFILRKSRVGSLLSAVLGLVVLSGVSLTGCADPYQEATEGYGQVVGLSYFGTHFHRLVLNPGENNVQTQWPDAGIGAIRLWDSGTLWSEIAVKPGQWVFDRMDAYVQYATVHHAEILYTLGGTPQWASARPSEKCSYGLGCAAEPVRMAHWEEYVRRVVQRYRGRIKYYELWNEPNFSDIARDRGVPGFYTGSVANMVEMARIARKVLDENDPDAVLSTPGFVNGSDRLELFLAAGGKQYVQAISYHFYSDSSERFVKQVDEVRAIMKRQGVEKLPLWNTETGVEVDPPDSAHPVRLSNLSYPEAAARLAKFMIMGSAAGFEHFYHYAWDNGRSGMMIQADPALSNLAAYEKTQAWLIGSKMLGCRHISPNAIVCEGEHAGARFAIAWSGSKSVYQLPAPAGWSIASLEYMTDSSAQPYAAPAADRMDRLELGIQPLYILYKAQPSAGQD